MKTSSGQQEKGRWKLSILMVDQQCPLQVRGKVFSWNSLNPGRRSGLHQICFAASEEIRIFINAL
jgi:hypothetical protein